MILPHQTALLALLIFTLSSLQISSNSLQPSPRSSGPLPFGEEDELLAAMDYFLQGLCLR